MRKSIIIDDGTIERLEKMGARRECNNGIDRLYLTPECAGLTYTVHRGTGAIKGAKLSGAAISKETATRIIDLMGDVWIDMATSEIVTGCDLFEDALEAIDLAESAYYEA